ncbi:MAG: hypothetical protein Q4E53_01965 [Eubacteriales bacterium]|nr:hypothetical protein [Eubacteriales bacterium]
MTSFEIANILAFDGCGEDEENNIKTYYFTTDKKEATKDIFKKVSGEDIDAYIARRSGGSNMELAGCAFCIDYNTAAKQVKSSFIIPHVKSYGMLMELFPVEVELEKELINLLFKKC